jgi:hypothetical protein
MCKINGLNSILSEHYAHSSADSFITISYCTVTNNIKPSYKHPRISNTFHGNFNRTGYRSLTSNVGYAFVNSSHRLFIYCNNHTTFRTTELLWMFPLI